MSFPTVDGQSELLDVYTPDTPAPAGGCPVMVAIHGGGWRRFRQDGLMACGSPTCSRGMVTWLSRPTTCCPRRQSDLAGEFRRRAGRRALGARQRGHAGYQPQRDRRRWANRREPIWPPCSGRIRLRASGDGVSAAVDAVVAVSTPTDLTTLYQREPASRALAAAQFLGGSPEQVPANYIAASPIDHVSPGDPPMLLIHGRQDPLIPVSQSEEMPAALTAAGVRNQLILVNGGHGLDFPAHYSNLVPDVLEFLDTTWKD